METLLQKAQRKYQEYLRNYYAHKDIFEDYYNGFNENNSTKRSIIDTTHKMNHCYDLLENLVYIFGEEVRSC